MALLHYSTNTPMASLEYKAIINKNNFVVMQKNLNMKSPVLMFPSSDEISLSSRQKALGVCAAVIGRLVIVW